MKSIPREPAFPAWMVRTAAALAVVATVLMFRTPAAEAVPSYSRQYGVECSTCHTMWGALNVGGVTFRLSGYRAVNGHELKQVADPVEVTKSFSLPATLPLSIVTGVGLESRNEKRSDPSQGSSASTTSEGTSLALEDLSIFLSGPINSHLSAFIEFPMFETRAWEFTPTGNFESHNLKPDQGRQVSFGTESPAFEVAKFWWNNLAGDNDSVNLLAGITHLPLAYAPGKVRLSVNQYLIYERTALDLISPRRVSDVVGGDPNDFLFRISEPQVMTEVNGMLMFGKPISDVTKKETFWAEYHLGVTNGSNAKAANHGGMSVYGRGIMRYYNQSFGVFAYSSPDTYNDSIRTTGSKDVNLATGTGIMSGAQSSNSTTRTGIDATLSLAPFGIPVNLENQYMWNDESNPTGFGEKFAWEGGFHQLNWIMSKTSVTYARYDYVTGGKFNDTNRTANGNTGITLSHPSESDVVLGFQHLIEQNIKMVFEVRQHQFDDTATGSITALGTTQSKGRIEDVGGTFRVMLGF